MSTWHLDLLLKGVDCAHCQKHIGAGELVALRQLRPGSSVRLPWSVECAKVEMLDVAAKQKGSA